jgi:hypothetical protein
MNLLTIPFDAALRRRHHRARQRLELADHDRRVEIRRALAAVHHPPIN